MNDITVMVREAKTVCQHCVDNSRQQSQDVGFVWCEHNHYGGVYVVSTGMWQIAGPFDHQDDFGRYLARSFGMKLA